MSNLEKIQKIYNVFRIIAMIAMIFSFIFAGTNLIGLIAAVILRDSRLFVELGNLAGSVEITGSIQIIANTITGIVTGVTNGLLSLFSMNYFASAKTDGTPFTKTGATTLRYLGIKTIVMPLVAIQPFVFQKKNIRAAFKIKQRDFHKFVETPLAVCIQPCSPFSTSLTILTTPTMLTKLTITTKHSQNSAFQCVQPVMSVKRV